MSTRLIVNADDLGLTPDVNDGIFEAMDAGLVSDASVLVTGAAIDHAVRGLAARDRRTAGLHVCLVDGELPAAPALQVAALLDDGRFPTRRRLFRRVATSPRAVLGAIAAEVEAQFQRAHGLGLHITHVDSHQHVHLFPGIAGVVIAACQRHGVRMLRAPVTRVRSVDAAGVATLSRRLRTLATRAGVVPFPSLGFEHSGRITAGAFRHYVDHASRVGAEVMVHPGRGRSDHIPRYAHWHYDWDRELDALRSGMAGRTLHAVSYAEALQAL